MPAGCLFLLLEMWEDGHGQGRGYRGQGMAFGSWVETGDWGRRGWQGPGACSAARKEAPSGPTSSR